MSSTTYIPRPGVAAVVDGLALGGDTFTVSGSTGRTSGVIKLDHISTIVAVTMTNKPKPGDILMVADTSASGIIAHTLTLPSGVTFLGGTSTATFNAPGECIILLAISPTVYLVLVNTGAVAFS